MNDQQIVAELHAVTNKLSLMTHYVHPKVALKLRQAVERISAALVAMGAE